MRRNAGVALKSVGAPLATACPVFAGASAAEEADAAAVELRSIEALCMDAGCAGFRPLFAVAAG